MTPATKHQIADTMARIYAMELALMVGRSQDDEFLASFLRFLGLIRSDLFRIAMESTTPAATGE